MGVENLTVTLLLVICIQVAYIHFHLKERLHSLKEENKLLRRELDKDVAKALRSANTKGHLVG